jgi:hypothetical protein
VTRIPSKDSKKSSPSVSGSNVSKASSSIFSLGGTLPPVPMIVGAGKGLLLEITVTLGLLI